MTAALYIAIAAAVGAGLWRRPDDAWLFAALRAALWVGWLHAVLDPQALRPALFAAAWFAALVVAAPVQHGRVLGPAALTWAMLGVAVQAALMQGTPRPWQVMVALAAAGSGCWLYRAMRTGRGLGGRLLLHWLSFAGTFAYLAPRLIHEHAGGAAAAAPVRVAAVVLALGSAALAAWASGAFARAGGTPEPLDAPVRLAADGAFALLRNPIQVAEMGLVGAAALWWPHPFTAAYALVFAAVLVGPVRWHEERRLALRFGDAYARYRARTPAYFPWLRRRAIATPDTASAGGV